MRRRRRQPRNIAGFVPRALVGHETVEDGGVVLLVPRFRARWTQWLQTRLKSPYIRVALDETGSAVWLLIDSRRTVLEIGEALEKKLGEKTHTSAQRLGLFLGMLRRNKFIALEEPGRAPEQLSPT